MRTILLAILFLLLGEVGAWWFDEWYGWLTGMGIFALRVGPMFLWRIVLRTVRRQIFKVLFIILPNSCKRPVLNARIAFRKWCEKLFGAVKMKWRSSWILRLIVLIPSILALCVIAYDQDGIVEFITLFAIPFLVTEIFPAGYWTYTFAFVLAYLASHGFEGAIERLSRFFPESFVEKYYEKRRDALKVIARHRRSATERVENTVERWRTRRAIRKMYKENATPPS